MNRSTRGTSTMAWSILWCTAIALALFLMLRADLAHLTAVSDFSTQGNPPPARDPSSPTGYVAGQRAFLGKHERGETYRWIEATEQLAATGPFGAKTYEGDTVPTGRPLLLPRLYAGWLATVAGSLHLVTGEPFPIALERAALWEPVFAHALIFAAAVIFMARRHGLASAAAVALLFAFFPPLFGQFLPGVLTSRTWALFFATCAIVIGLPHRGREGSPCSTGAAVTAALALWLDPACGFPAVLLSAVMAGTAVGAQKKTAPFLLWALVGSGVTLAAWWIDRCPAAVGAGELRYVHPLYAAGWLGLGLALDGAQRLRGAGRVRSWRTAELGAGVLLLGWFGYVQLHHAYLGWLYPSVWLLRFTSLDPGSTFTTAAAWLARARFPETVLICAPTVAAAGVLTLALTRTRAETGPSRRGWTPVLVAFAALLLLASLRVRWIAVTSLVAVPILAHLTWRGSPALRRIVASVAAIFLLGLFLWSQALPAAFQRPAGKIEPDATDLEALVYRHFSHWLASHAPRQTISALAPPELSDSIVFHGGGRVLMSTAWESYPGQLAARRILSAPEWTEAEAVLQGHEITHVILPSWDKVLPLLVQAPVEPGKEALLARLQRWVFPPFLRPLPYRPPPLPAFASEQLVVFQVTAPQDEPLQLSRLAEYFVEMERAEPAAMVARVLKESHPDDPNAGIARATVHAYARDRAALEPELDRLVADAKAGRVPFSWDRRVQRAIVLALTRQREVARAEVAACLAAATEDDVLALTPLQAYRLAALARAHELAFAEPSLTPLLASLGAEYTPRTPPPPR